jgi:hypothetical protein
MATVKTEAEARQHIMDVALKWNGWGNGAGYPGKSGNPACRFMGLGTTFSCACGVSMNCSHGGFPLKSMQVGYRTGYTYCPAGYAAAKDSYHAIIDSWKCQVGDILFIHDPNVSEKPNHTEQVYKVTGAGASRRLYSIGWDSGPSNVDGYKGQGGVHLHYWDVPDGKGNDLIYGAADLAKLVVGGFSQFDVKPKPALHGPRPLTKTETGQVVAFTNKLPGHHLTAGNGGLHAVRKAIAALQALLKKPKAAK